MKQYLALTALLSCLAMPAKAAVVDILFVMDASGSVTSSGWTNEINFVTDLASEFRERSVADGNTYNFAAVQFASSATLRYRFTDGQELSAFNNVIKKLSFTQGNTATLSALNTAVSHYKTSSDTEHFRRIVLITDGNPNPPDSQNPCDITGAAPSAPQMRADLQSLAIGVTLVAVGPGINTGRLSCLGDNVVFANSFDQATLDAAVDDVVAATLPAAEVPLPASAWLFGSALAGLIARQKNSRVENSRKTKKAVSFYPFFNHHLKRH